MSKPQHVFLRPSSDALLMQGAERLGAGILRDGFNPSHAADLAEVRS